jgi:hypothetical protein
MKFSTSLYTGHTYLDIGGDLRGIRVQTGPAITALGFFVFIEILDQTTCNSTRHVSRNRPVLRPSMRAAWAVKRPGRPQLAEERANNKELGGGMRTR